jgi:hypothetical protein
LKLWSWSGAAIVLSCSLTACGDSARAAEPVATPAAREAVVAAAKEPTSQAAPPAAAIPDDGSCAAICSETHALGCSTELVCLATCGEMRASTVCTQQIGAFLTCAATRKRADWECGDEPLPVLREGVCNAEQAAISGCLEQLATQ